MGAEWAGAAGRGPPVAPRCDYVVDKVLGRKVFLVSVSGGHADGSWGKGWGGRGGKGVEWSGVKERRSERTYEGKEVV